MKKIKRMRYKEAYELGYEQGAAIAFGIIGMAEAIMATDRSRWDCGDCGLTGLTWQRWCPKCSPERQ